MKQATYMIDLTGLPATTQELDAWLRSTNVGNPKDEAPPLVPSSRRSSSRSSHGGDGGGAKRRGRGRRRSSLDEAAAPDADCFGVDELALLAADPSGGEERRGRGDETDWRLVSEESDCGLASSRSDGARKRPAPVSSDAPRAASFAFRVHARAIPAGNDFRRSFSDRRERDDRVAPSFGRYPRSLSLPDTSGRARGGRDDFDGGGPLVLGASASGRIESLDGRDGAAGERLVAAMERSQRSRDCIRKRFSENSSTRGLAAMGETGGSRRRLLRALGGRRGRDGGRRGSRRGAGAPEGEGVRGGCGRRPAPSFRPDDRPPELACRRPVGFSLGDVRVELRRIALEQLTEMEERAAYRTKMMEMEEGKGVVPSVGSRVGFGLEM